MLFNINPVSWKNGFDAVDINFIIIEHQNYPAAKDTLNQWHIKEPFDSEKTNSPLAV